MFSSVIVFYFYRFQIRRFSISFAISDFLIRLNLTCHCHHLQLSSLLLLLLLFQLLVSHNFIYHSLTLFVGEFYADTVAHSQLDPSFSIKIGLGVSVIGSIIFDLMWGFSSVSMVSFVAFGLVAYGTFYLKFLEFSMNFL